AADAADHQRRPRGDGVRVRPDDVAAVGRSARRHRARHRSRDHGRFPGQVRPADRCEDRGGPGPAAGPDRRGRDLGPGPRRPGVDPPRRVAGRPTPDVLRRLDPGARDPWRREIRGLHGHAEIRRARRQLRSPQPARRRGVRAEVTPAEPVETTAPPAARWRALTWLALTALLGMSTWFSGTAVIGPLRVAWSLTPAQASWLTIAVQLGFVTGALASALTNLVDLMPARALMVLSAIAAAAANAAFSAATGPALGLRLRFLTGVCLAGVYPTGLKLMATWFRADRGRALGIMVGSLTLGSAAPHLVRGLGATFPWRDVVLATSGLTLAGALVGW